jgi:16S rRNA (cytosine1402-N4)-methyltransferase
MEGFFLSTSITRRLRERKNNFNRLERDFKRSNETSVFSIRRYKRQGLVHVMGYFWISVSPPTSSSIQKKGLSFLQEGSLDMRLGPQSNEDGLTAADIVNGWSKQELSTLLQEYGEERFAWKIAEAICKARKSARIVGTLDLVSVIKMAVPASYEHGRIHPATRTFQALRMAVNDEIPALKQAVQAAASILRPGGRCAIITFHSIEDRVVKHLFQNEELWEPVAKKPIAPTEAECERNPRARSAKLRVARRM